MRISISKSLTSNKGVGVRSPWMWASGTLNVAGYVDNSKTFNLTAWMWAYGRLLVFGVVDNSQVF